MISIQNLNFEYPGTHALQDISCEIPGGSITALVGPNGAGKTTLMRSISALANPVSGKVLLDGVDTSDNPRAIHQKCSYLSDFFGLYDELTAIQCLQYAASIHQCAEGEINTLITQALKDLELEQHQDKKAGELSRGLRQRLAVAQTILHRPKYILLDEPASGLDPHARMQLSDLLLKLRDSGMTLIVSSHILAELEDYCTHIMILKEGRLVEFSDISNQTQQAMHYRITLVDDTDMNQFVDKIKDIAAIEITSVKNNYIDIVCDTIKMPQPEILKQLLAQGVPVASFGPSTSRLQDHYKKLTHSDNEGNNA